MITNMLHVNLLIIVLLANIVLAVQDNLAYHKFANADLRNDLLVRTGRSILPKNPKEVTKPNENPNTEGHPKIKPKSGNLNIPEEDGKNPETTIKFEELQQKYQNLKISYQNLKSEGTSQLTLENNNTTTGTTNSTGDIELNETPEKEVNVTESDNISDGAKVTGEPINENSNITQKNSRHSEHFMAQMVNDPILLRRILESLLIDDLEQKNQLNVTKLVEEMGFPLEIEADIDERILNLEVTPRASRSTQSSYEESFELTPEQMDFFGDGI